MCETNKEIKFCTCGEIERPDWKLTRAASLYEFPMHTMGRWVEDDEDRLNAIKVQKIKEKLDNNTLLDIKGYTPAENDTLEVYRLAIYTFKNNAWKIESTYHPFAGSVSVSKTDGSQVFKGTME